MPDFSAILSRLSHPHNSLFHFFHSFCQLFLLNFFVFSPDLRCSISFLAISFHCGDQADMSALSVNTGVGVSPRAVRTPKRGSAAMMVMRTEAVVWSDVVWKSKFADCFNVHRVNAMFLHGWNEIMYDCRSVNLDTNIGGWNQHWKVTQSFCPVLVDPIDPLIMLIMLHEDDNNYVPRLANQGEHADTVIGIMGPQTCCLDWPEDRYYLIQAADALSRALNFDLRYLSDLARRLR